MAETLYVPRGLKKPVMPGHAPTPNQPAGVVRARTVVPPKVTVKQPK